MVGSEIFCNSIIQLISVIIWFHPVPSHSFGLKLQSHSCIVWIPWETINGRERKLPKCYNRFWNFRRKDMQHPGAPFEGHVMFSKFAYTYPNFDGKYLFNIHCSFIFLKLVLTNICLWIISYNNCKCMKILSPTNIRLSLKGLPGTNRGVLDVQTFSRIKKNIECHQFKKICRPYS